MTDSNAIQRLTIAVRMLAEARDLGDIMRLREMAQVAEQYAKAEKLGDEAVQYAQEIRLRAARKAGEVLRDMADTGGRYVQGGDHKSKSRPAILKLADLGVDRNQSSRWQRIAAVPEEEFEAKVAAGWGETAIAEGARHARPSRAKKKRPARPPGPKTKTNGFTHKQSLIGLESVAAQIQAIAEVMDEGLVGDWSRLHADPDAQGHFDSIQTYLPILTSRLKRALRDWKGAAA